MLIAAFMRLWQINVNPGGLFPDEAANGLDINMMFNGQLQPFYERGNGREALFFYVIWFVVSLFGRGVWQHHIVSASFGIAEVFAAYLLAYRLFNKRVALLSAFLMATSSYAVLISRTAFRANTIPLFTSLTLYFLVKMFQVEDKKSKLWAAFWAGVMFGLGFYTYISYRMMIPLLFGFGALLTFAFRDQWPLLKSYIKPKLAFIGGFVISFAWLAHYFITHPGSFVGRAGQVSIFSESLNHGDVFGTFLEMLRLTMLSFFTHGDENWRHNVSGYPFLSVFVAPFFAVGLVWFTLSIFRFLKEVWKKKVTERIAAEALIAILFWFMIVPEVTTAEGIPHGLRLIGMMPAIFIMSAYGMVSIWGWMTQHMRLKLSKLAIPAVLLTCILCYNFYLYFGVAVNSPEYYYAFRSDLTTVSEYLNERNNKEMTYLSLDEFSVQTVEYLTTVNRQPYMLVNPADTYKVDLKPGQQVVFTMSTMYDIKKFVEEYPEAKLVKEVRNRFRYLVMRVYEMP
jgi:4-amino-4-deoxy-L-arabinose transferase-like glycosyltransferase